MQEHLREVNAAAALPLPHEVGAEVDTPVAQHPKEWGQVRYDSQGRPLPDIAFFSPRPLDEAPNGEAGRTETPHQ